MPERDPLTTIAPTPALNTVPREVSTPTAWPFPGGSRPAMPPAPEQWFRHLETIRSARQAALDAALKRNFPRAAHHAARIQAAAQALVAMLDPSSTSSTSSTNDNDNDTENPQ